MKIHSRCLIFLLICLVLSWYYTASSNFEVFIIICITNTSVEKIGRNINLDVFLSDCRYMVSFLYCNPYALTLKARFSYFSIPIRLHYYFSFYPSVRNLDKIWTLLSKPLSTKFCHCFACGLCSSSTFNFFFLHRVWVLVPLIYVHIADIQYIYILFKNNSGVRIFTGYYYLLREKLNLAFPLTNTQ